MATATEARTPNREIDGFAHSGNYGLKAIIPQWMRESPGRYWIAYVGFVASVILSLLFRCARGLGYIHDVPIDSLSAPAPNPHRRPAPGWAARYRRPAIGGLYHHPAVDGLHRRPTVGTGAQPGLNVQELITLPPSDHANGTVDIGTQPGLNVQELIIDPPSDHVNGTVGTGAQPGVNAQELMLKIQSIILAVCLMYVTVVNNTVGELMMTYVVGLCEMQIMIDTIRISIVKQDDKVQSYLTLAFFAVMSILAVVLQDSFGPLNRLNLAYFVCLWFLIYFAVPDNYFERTGTEATKIVGGALASAASAAHMGFCLAAFNITKEVEDVPGEVIAAFFYTTVAMFSLSHSFPDLLASVRPDFLPKLNPHRPHFHVVLCMVTGFAYWCQIWNRDSFVSQSFASPVLGWYTGSCLSWANWVVMNMYICRDLSSYIFRW